jgi:hypothetical protein
MELAENQELDSCPENPNTQRTLPDCNPKFLPERVTDIAPLAATFAVPFMIECITASKVKAELVRMDDTAIETTTLDKIVLPRETLQTMELSASHMEFSHADMPFLDVADASLIPRPTVAITTGLDPVDATLAIARITLSGDVYENDRDNVAVFKSEELTSLIDVKIPWHDLETIEESDVQNALGDAENPILTDGDRENCPTLEPKKVTKTEPEVGELRCIKDATVRNGNTANIAEL